MTETTKPVEGQRTIVARPEPMRNRGHITYVCAACGETLADGFAPGAFPNCVFVCPKCGAYNESLD